MLHSQARDGLIFRIKTWPRNGANCRLINFSKRCCLNATRRRQAIVLRRKRVGKCWTHATHAAGSGEPANGYVDQQARLSGRKGDAGPRAVCCWRIKFIGSSERTEPIAPDQSARRNGNLHRTFPSDRRDGYCRLSYSCKLASYCEYGPIFNPLRPDLKERLQSATPQFLVGPRIQLQCMRYWMRKHARTGAITPVRQAPASPELLRRHGWRPLSPVGQPDESVISRSP